MFDVRRQRLPEDDAGERNGSADSPFAELLREIDRSRRYRRQFALLGIVDPARVSALRSLVRSMDRVWVADGYAYVLLPESDRDVAAGFVDRLARHQVIDADEAKIAVFPDDGLTTRALVSTARPQSTSQKRPSARPVTRLRSLRPGAIAAPTHAD